jgi:hypothetical protein
VEGVRVAARPRLRFLSNSRRFRSACSVLAIVALAGCGKSELIVSFDSASVRAEDVAGLEVEVRDRGRIRRFKGSDFRGTPDLMAPHVRTNVAGGGEITVRGRLTAGLDTIADGQIAFAARSGMIWSVNIFRAVTNPMNQCFGCRGSASAEIMPNYRRAVNERLWLVYGGAEKGSDRVY